MTFKLAVVGSRTITSEQKVLCAMNNVPWIPDDVQTLSPEDIDLEIVTGGAGGVDTIAEEWALEHGFDVTIHNPDWSDWRIHKPDWSDWRDGHPALARNTEIVEDSDGVLAVWDGNSNGTRDSIDKALKRGKRIYVEVFNE